MGIGKDIVDSELPGVVGQAAIGETAYRGYYRFYDEVMRSASWGDMDPSDDSWKEQLVSADV